MAMVLRARVKKGRLVLDEPTELPEGAEVELVVAWPDDAGEGAPAAAGGDEPPPENDEGARFLAPSESADDDSPAGEGAAADAILEQVQRQTRG